MAKIVNISSSNEFADILKKSRVVVADFYAEWCPPCKAIAPLYEKCAESLSQPNIVTFVKINTDNQKDIARAYSITSMPTFMFFREGKEVGKVVGADPRKLQDMVAKIGDAAAATSATSAGSSSDAAAAAGSSEVWMGAPLPRVYSDITQEIEQRGLELLNADDEAGPVSVLFEASKPSALGGAQGAKKDWVESGADDQLLLFIPLRSVAKVHTIQFTSLPPSTTDDDEEPPMRPATIHLYTNRSHNLDFSEADDTPPTQAITLNSSDWNKDGTASVSLRFVKFQNITSIVIYVVKGDGDGENVRLDRVRLIGEAGEKREMGKLEKIGDLPGE